MTPYEYVGMQKLGVGETKRGECPKCGGKNTFTMYNNGKTTLFNCFRATCGTSGAIASGPPALEDMRENTDIYDRLEEKAMKRMRPFSIPKSFVSLHDRYEALAYLAKYPCKKAILDDRVDVRWDVKRNLLVFLTWYSHECYNAVGRNVMNLPNTPKWFIYQKPNVGFWAPKDKDRESDLVCVVEDAVSACCVANEADGFALLGTTLTDIHKYIIAHYKKALVFLDPDADHKAKKIIEELSPYVETKIIMSTKDPKDMNILEIKRTIRDGKNNTKDVAEAVLLGDIWKDDKPESISGRSAADL